jgi:hypothetical protein
MAKTCTPEQSCFSRLPGTRAKRARKAPGQKQVREVAPATVAAIQQDAGQGMVLGGANELVDTAIVAWRCSALRLVSVEGGGPALIALAVLWKLDARRR